MVWCSSESNSPRLILSTEQEVKCLNNLQVYPLFFLYFNFYLFLQWLPFCFFFFAMYSVAIGLHYDSFFLSWSLFLTLHRLTHKDHVKMDAEIKVYEWRIQGIGGHHQRRLGTSGILIFLLIPSISWIEKFSFHIVKDCISALATRFVVLCYFSPRKGTYLHDILSESNLMLPS